MRIQKINKVRSQVGVLTAALMISATAQAELVGHWTFDETSGTTASNSAAAGLYDGTVVNPVWTSGVIGGALEMNGTDCDVSGLGDVLSTVSNELTIAFWCAGDLSEPQSMNGFSGYSDGERNLNNHLPSGTTVYFDAGYIDNVTTNGRERISKYVGSADASLLRGPWNHWAFTKNATTGDMIIYQNGALWHDSTGTGPFNGNMAGITEFFIGSEAGSKNFYKGMMDDFRVYDNALSLTEISDLYTAVTLDYAIAYATVTPDKGSIPLDVVFDASTSVSSGSITNYLWDFGDGTTGDGVSVAHTYTVTNIYTVSLAISDDAGNVDSVQFEVEAKPAATIEIDSTVWSGAALTDLPAFSSNDLAQVYYLSSSGTVGSDSNTTTDEHHARFFDGSILLDPANGVDKADCVGWDEESTATINFDLSVNKYGYDITNIVTIAGWSTGSGGRANQGYGVVVTFVDDSQAILAAATHWAPNNPTRYWTRVSLIETNGNVMASGVKSVTFNFSEEARPGGRVYGREIDIMGAPTAPSHADPAEAAFTNGMSSLAWNSNWDFIYSVQTNLDLAFGEWGTFTNVTGTPPQTTVDLPAEDQPALFYRVIVE